MSSKTFWFSFGDLRLGEKFVFQNPYCRYQSATTSEILVKISSRKYRVVNGPGAGREWQTSTKSSVRRL